MLEASPPETGPLDKHGRGFRRDLAYGSVSLCLLGDLAHTRSLSWARRRSATRVGSSASLSEIVKRW